MNFRSRRSAGTLRKRDGIHMIEGITTTNRANKVGEVSGGYPPDLKKFRSLVWKYWRREGRHTLPWRKTNDPYKILVSEVMLQQTQVSRVLEKYKSFVRKFPTTRALARASLAEILKEWSGLGYNRRAKFLRDATREIVEKHGGRVPKDKAALRALSGVGEYTAAAICVFAYDASDVLVETNIRTAIMHHFFPNNTRVHDTSVRAIAEMLARGQKQREWHAALMDYGAHLKASGVRLNKKSAHYTKQKAFKGSLREVRGAVLRELYKRNPSLGTLTFPKNRIRVALAALEHDGLLPAV